jgi:hypothetical protein
MKFYKSCIEAIYDLQQNGFTNYFQLFGSNLLWVQKGFFIHDGEFAIREFHQIESPDNGAHDILIFAIVTNKQNIKGILFNHYNNYLTRTPSILVEKLNALQSV